MQTIFQNGFIVANAIALRIMRMEKKMDCGRKKIDYFNPPKCSNNDCKEEVLEQIRFVMTCKDGHIHDIPWKHWNTFLT